MSDMSINFDSPTYCYSTKRIQKIGIQTACKTSTIIQITIMQFLRIQGCGKACQAVQTFTPRVVRWYPTLEAALQAIHGGLSAFFKNKTQESPFSNLQHRRSMKITSRRNENWYFVADLMQLSRFEALNSFESPAIQSVWRLARSVRWRTFFKVLYTSNHIKPMSRRQRKWQTQSAQISEESLSLQDSYLAGSPSKMSPARTAASVLNM